jgi:hypothetical protein
MSTSMSMSMSMTIVKAMSKIRPLALTYGAGTLDNGERQGPDAGNSS